MTELEESRKRLAQFVNVWWSTRKGTTVIQIGRGEDKKKFKITEVKRRRIMRL